MLLFVNVTFFPLNIGDLLISTPCSDLNFCAIGIDILPSQQPISRTLAFFNGFLYPFFSVSVRLKLILAMIPLKMWLYIRFIKVLGSKTIKKNYQILLAPSESTLQ